MCSDRDAAGSQRRVSPFGNPRIDACTRLPEAYRSVPRPSSAFGAKASTVSPYYLAHVMQRNRTSSLSFYRKFALYSVGKVLSRRSQPPPGAPHAPSGAPGEGSLASFSQQDPAHRRAFFHLPSTRLYKIIDLAEPACSQTDEISPQ